MVAWAKAQGVHFAPVEFKSVEVLKNMPPSWVTPALTEVPAVEHTADDNAEVERVVEAGPRATTANTVCFIVTLAMSTKCVLNLTVCS